MSQVIRNLTPSKTEAQQRDTVAFDIEETCRRLGNISIPTIYKLIATGMLQPTKLFRRTMFTDAAIRECLRKGTRQ